MIIDSAEKMYPNSEEREKNLIASLNTLKNMREEAKQLGAANHMQKSIESSTVLCVSFVEPSFKHMAVAGLSLRNVTTMIILLFSHIASHSP